MQNPIGTYAKSIVMIIAAGLGILAAALSDNVVTSVELINIVLAVFNAVLVYGIANLAAGPRQFTKTFITLGIAIGQALVPTVAAVGGFTHVGTGDYLMALLSGLAAIGVYVVPNTPAKAVIA